MRLSIHVAFLCLFLVAALLAAPSGQVAGSGAAAPKIELLTADEGMTVLGVAVQSRRHFNAKMDCSHLVHAVYERAGLPYPYARSSDLYQGTAEFRQVSRPQAGDLIAWPGHVGIVANPRKRTFFSKLRSGIGIDEYDAPAWRRRGRPHFLRYVRANEAEVRVASAEAPAAKVPAAVATIPRPPRAENAGYKIRPSGGLRVHESATSRVESLPSDVYGGAAVPHIQSLDSEKPTPDEVKKALSQAFSDTGEALLAANVFTVSPEVAILDDFEVKKVSLHGDEGWAEVRISEPSSISAGKANLSKRLERQRIVLNRRANSSWDLTLPSDTVYIPRAFAVRILAHQLATLTEDSPEAGGNSQQKAELARLLNQLLAK
jgi:hypothetical protein